MSPARQKLLILAREALRNRADLAGAGRQIMQSYGLTEAEARQLHSDEVAFRKRERSGA